MITQEKIDRINALARKAKTPEGLTAEVIRDSHANMERYAVAETVVVFLEETE